ncbi:MAG: putative LPS assembly protein LptD, partial [bacterium]|nr:putative LPS assembly protein LptD [bacterium]
ARELEIQGALNVNSQHKPLGWLDLSPRFSIQNQFINSTTDSTTRRETYSASVNLGTGLYGLFQTNLGRIKGIRHRLQPRISMNYNQNAALVGGTFGFGAARDWADPRRSLNFSLNNSLELKTEHGGNLRRFTFATLNFQTGYDLDRPIQKLRDLSTTASVKPDQRVDIRLTMRHNLEDAQGTFDPRLESLTVTSNFRFDGQKSSTADTRLESGSDFGIERDLTNSFSNAAQPWHLNLSHYINYTRLSPGAQAGKRSWIKADLGFNPIAQTRLDYSVNIEIIPRRSVVAQTLSLYRDLHCWETRFSWYPTGYNKGFYFKINIKDIPQIKFEHRRGGFGI